MWHMMLWFSYTCLNVNACLICLYSLNKIRRSRSNYWSILYGIFVQNFIIIYKLLFIMDMFYPRKRCQLNTVAIIESEYFIANILTTSKRFQMVSWWLLRDWSESKLFNGIVSNDLLINASRIILSFNFKIVSLKALSF